MQRIGLTGGIAAGKSVAAGRLAELGAVVIDYDQLAREAVEPGSVGLDEVAEAFGPGVLTAEGELDRAALAEIVFADPASLDRLNGIIHPVVRRLSAEREAAAAVADHGAVVVHDIPLLVETGRGDEFHVLVVVDAPAELRLRRLVDGRGLDPAEAQRRLAAQTTDAVRIAAADVVLDGTREDADLRAQVDTLWARLAAERAEELAAEVQ